MSKIAINLREAILESGLADGMTISFHHHLRNGDMVMNMVMDEIAQMGIKDITIHCSSIMDVHAPLLEHIKNGVVTGLEASYIGPAVGRELSKGILEKPVIFRTHGGRASDVINGKCHIDVAFIAASAVDREGNCTGKIGPAAFGGMGYAVADAKYANYKIAVTDYLVEEVLLDASIQAKDIHKLVVVDQIGDPDGIVSSTTQVTRSPTRLKIAEDTLKVMTAAGYVKSGLKFQTGAGGVSLAVAKYLRDKMLKENIRGDFCLGGITGYMVQMLHEGCFEQLLDAQCFDREAIRSLNEDPNHVELTSSKYASPTDPTSYVNELDVVILGATEIDLNFNVNVHTDSYGRIMGGSGGHSDAAEGAKLCIIVAPLMRGRISVIRDRVTTISTPGSCVDVLVTEYGIAVNPNKPELRQALVDAGVKVMDIEKQYEVSLNLAGKPAAIRRGEKEVALVVYRNGEIIDRIYNTIV